jgi:hypothetical protein
MDEETPENFLHCEEQFLGQPGIETRCPVSREAILLSRNEIDRRAQMIICLPEVRKFVGDR